MTDEIEEPGFGTFGGFSEFLQSFKDRPLPLVQSLRYRKGGDISNWGDPGGTNYAPRNGFIMAGSSSWSGVAAPSGSITVLLPAQFIDVPLILATITHTVPLFQDVRCQAYADAASIEIYWFSSVNLTTVWVNWLVIGPAGV